MNPLSNELDQAIHEVLAFLPQDSILEAEKKKEKDNTAPSISLSPSIKPSKELLTPSTVSDHVSDSADRCVENNPTLCRTHVSDHVSRGWQLHEKLAEHSVAKYMLVPGSPEESITNICATALLADDPYPNLRQLLNYSRLDLLFGPDDWQAKAHHQLNAMKQQRVKSGKALLLYAFVGAVRDHVDADRLVVKDRSRLTERELAYVAKTITSKVEANWRRFSQPYAELATTYFLSKGFPQTYKKVTGRSIGRSRHKVAAITDILDEFGIIEKVEQWDHETRRRQRNLYQIGPNNPYRSKVGDPTTPNGTRASQ